MEVSPLYQIKVKCTCCEQQFQTSKVRPSFKKSKGSDTDFCVHYKEMNPEYYVVRVCPFCGFSMTENFSDKMTPRQKSDYYDKLGSKWVSREFGGERDWATAMQSFKLALLCAQIKGERDRILAGLLHHIAWLYREKSDKEQELRFLQFALDAYVRVFQGEEENMNNARLMYLMGELNRRLKKYHEAVRWFGRVINDKKIMDAAMIRACREQWVQTREDMLADKLDLPEELQEEEKKKK
ncbi:DUF2225 domain-containing protein [Paenibacillus koleovorans]|uniref:DUF2225 domain-containing protein n=1 Tax=Paenibacillus koleovorans TaxID=121608 RepID=UPI000FD94633|nr:DUF2225 domain-containing protein [Paenibacillus koleovorans]